MVIEGRRVLRKKLDKTSAFRWMRGGFCASVIQITCILLQSAISKICVGGHNSYRFLEPRQSMYPIAAAMCGAGHEES